MVDTAWPDPEQIRKDIIRVDEMIAACWIVIRVTARDGAGGVLARIAKAWASRT